MEIKNLPLSSVFPSPMNPRKTFDEESLKELAENIHQQGLLQPITVRTKYADSPNKYEIVCGERRYRAMRMIAENTGNTHLTIPAIITEMTDDEAFDAMITENLQRKDVDPIEEAYAFGELAKKGGDIRDIALRFGKSVRFVQDRIKLNALVPELMKELKEDNMPISAAMVICKLDDEQQRLYYRQFKDSYQGFTTATATGFVRGLFLRIDNAVWHGDDENFSGGCGISCSQCIYNTANQGCFFHEMKAEVGECTNEDRFVAKTVTYVEAYLNDISDMLIRAGEPLTFGKTVVALGEESSYIPERTKRIRAAVRAKIEELGYEVVDPRKVFKSKCYYDIDDERTKEMLDKGECYRVLQLSNYNYIKIEDEVYYVNKSDAPVSEASGIPQNALMLINKYKTEQQTFANGLSLAGAKAIEAHGKNLGLGLDSSEFRAFYGLLLNSSFELKRRMGLSHFAKSNEVLEWIDKNEDKVLKLIREWIKMNISSNTNETVVFLEPLLDRLGELWCPIEYREALEKRTKNHEKLLKRYEKQLAGMGYRPDGSKIEQNG